MDIKARKRLLRRHACDSLAIQGRPHTVSVGQGRWKNNNLTAAPRRLTKGAEKSIAQILAILKHTRTLFVQTGIWDIMYIAAQGPSGHSQLHVELPVFEKAAGLDLGAAKCLAVQRVRQEPLGGRQAHTHGLVHGAKHARRIKRHE